MRGPRSINMLRTLNLIVAISVAATGVVSQPLTVREGRDGTCALPITTIVEVIPVVYGTQIGTNGSIDLTVFSQSVMITVSNAPFDFTSALQFTTTLPVTTAVAPVTTPKSSILRSKEEQRYTLMLIRLIGQSLPGLLREAFSMSARRQLYSRPRALQAGLLLPPQSPRACRLQHWFYLPPPLRMARPWHHPQRIHRPEFQSKGRIWRWQ